MCAFSTKLPVFVIRHVCHYASGPFIMKVARQRDDVEGPSLSWVGFDLSTKISYLHLSTCSFGQKTRSSCV